MEIPFGSKHSDNAAPCTAWGANQKKIAVNAAGDVFTGYMDNDEVLGFTVVSHRFDNWTKGVKLRAQRPGNVLLDCFGNLHVFVVDGRRLMHHVFRGGDVLRVSSTTEVFDRCNIRFSVDIRGPRVFVAFGHDSRVHFLDGYLMRNGTVARWRHRSSVKLPCNFAYPFALIRRSGKLVALAEEDEDGHKKYTMSCLFEEDDLDMPHVLEHYTNGNSVHNNDLYEDSGGLLHVIVRVHPDERHFIHAREIVPGTMRFARTRLNFPDLTHLRLTEDVADGVQYVGTSWDRLWKCATGCPKDDITPAEMKDAGDKCAGLVPFVVDDDVLLLPAAASAYPDARTFMAHAGVNVPEPRYEGRARCSEWAWSILETVRHYYGRLRRRL